MDGPQKRQTHFSSGQVDSRQRNNKTSSLVDHPFFGLPNPEILKTEPTTTRERDTTEEVRGFFLFFVCDTHSRKKEVLCTWYRRGAIRREPKQRKFPRQETEIKEVFFWIILLSVCDWKER